MIRLLGTIMGLAGREVRERSEWFAASLFLYAVLSFLALATAAALLAALGIAVAGYYGAVAGALSVAGLCLLLSAALLVGWRIAARRHNERMRARRSSLLNPALASLALSALPLSRTPGTGKTLLMAAGLFAAGFFLASATRGEDEGDDSE